MRKLGQREKSYIFVCKISSKQNKLNMRVHVQFNLNQIKNIFSSLQGEIFLKYELHNVINNVLSQTFMSTVLVYTGCHNQIPHAGWLNQEKFIFHSYGGQEGQDQGACQFKLKIQFFGFQRAAFSLCPHMVEKESVLVSFLVLGTLVPLNQGPTFITSFNLYHLLTGSVYKFIHTGDQGYNR